MKRFLRVGAVSITIPEGCCTSAAAAGQAGRAGNDGRAGLTGRESYPILAREPPAAGHPRACVGRTPRFVSKDHPVMLTTDLGACEWFVWDLRRSNLIDRGQLDGVIGEFLAKHPGAEPPHLAEYLVAGGLLTDFQAER